MNNKLMNVVFTLVLSLCSVAGLASDAQTPMADGIYSGRTMITQSDNQTRQLAITFKAESGTLVSGQMALYDMYMVDNKPVPGTSPALQSGFVITEQLDPEKGVSYQIDKEGFLTGSVQLINVNRSWPAITVSGEMTATPASGWYSFATSLYNSLTATPPADKPVPSSLNFSSHPITLEKQL